MPKITALTAQVLKSYEYPHGGWVLVRIYTEEGIQGVGECFVSDRFGSAVFAARDLIDRRLAQEVVGRKCYRFKLFGSACMMPANASTIAAAR